VSYPILVAFVLFAIAMFFTPGPNNIMLMSSGLNHGLRRTQPHLWGVVLGFSFMILIVGLGLGAVLAASPRFLAAIRYVGAAYLAFMAWQIARSGEVDAQGQSRRPFSFLEAFAFQWVNPKGWVIIAGAVSSYAALAAYPANIALMAAVAVVVGLASALTWAMFGTSLRRFVTQRRFIRIFNWAMALLLVGSLWPILAHAGEEAPVGADWRASVRHFALEHFKNPAWGYSHSVRDYELARALAREDHVALDDDVLYASAFLHDIAAFDPWNREKEGIDHADEGARIVDGVLRDTGFPMSKIERVRGAIRTHMYDRTPAGPEALYLHDADALDWLGAIGVARIMGLVDPNGGDPDGPKAVKMLEDNLRDVPPGVRSPAGRRMLPARREELARYLRELRRETGDYRTL